MEDPFFDEEHRKKIFHNLLKKAKKEPKRLRIPIDDEFKEAEDHPLLLNSFATMNYKTWEASNKLRRILSKSMAL